MPPFRPQWTAPTSTASRSSCAISSMTSGWGCRDITAVASTAIPPAPIVSASNRSYFTTGSSRRRAASRDLVAGRRTGDLAGVLVVGELQSARHAAAETVLPLDERVHVLEGLREFALVIDLVLEDARPHRPLVAEASDLARGLRGARIRDDGHGDEDAQDG